MAQTDPTATGGKAVGSPLFWYRVSAEEALPPDPEDEKDTELIQARTPETAIIIAARRALEKLGYDSRKLLPETEISI